MLFGDFPLEARLEAIDGLLLSVTFFVAGLGSLPREKVRLDEADFFCCQVVVVDRIFGVWNESLGRRLSVFFPGLAEKVRRVLK